MGHVARTGALNRKENNQAITAAGRQYVMIRTQPAGDRTQPAGDVVRLKRDRCGSYLTSILRGLELGTEWDIRSKPRRSALPPW